MSLLETKNLSESYPAIAPSVPLARQTVVSFALAAGATGEQVDAIALAVSEALTNVVMHAYHEQPPGTIQVTAALTAGALWVLVGDDGAGFCVRPDSPGLGIGLALIAQASDDFAIVKRSSGGTELRMRFRLRASDVCAGQVRGSSDSATRPPSPTFSTTR